MGVVLLILWLVHIAFRCCSTAGLTVGDPVLRRKQPLSVELGPGIMGTIFDGIQRPLEYIARGSADVFVPRGVDVPALERGPLWQYTPQIKVGDLISGGDIFGTVITNTSQS